MDTLFAKTVKGYLNTPVCMADYCTQRLRLYSALFLFIAISVVVLHRFLNETNDLLVLLRHAGLIALGYTAGLALLEFLIRWVCRTKSLFLVMRIRTIWLLSFAAYLTGFITLGGINNSESTVYLHGQPVSANMFLKLLPIWLLFTYIFIQARLKTNLSNQNMQLESFNTELIKRLHTIPASQRNYKTKPDIKHFIVKCEGEQYKITPARISHISVDDHYSYIFLENEKLLVHLPLKQAISQLPHDMFVQPHRSHLVNLEKVGRIRRTGRNYELVMQHTEWVVPVSRHRAAAVIPVIERFLVQTD